MFGFFSKNKHASVMDSLDKIEDKLDNLYTKFYKGLTPAEKTKAEAMVGMFSSYEALLEEHGLGMPGISLVRGRVVLEPGADPEPFCAILAFGKSHVETCEGFVTSEAKRVKNDLGWVVTENRIGEDKNNG